MNHNIVIESDGQWLVAECQGDHYKIISLPLSRPEADELAEEENQAWEDADGVLMLAELSCGMGRN